MHTPSPRKSHQWPESLWIVLVCVLLIACGGGPSPEARTTPAGYFATRNRISFGPTAGQGTHTHKAEHATAAAKRVRGFIEQSLSEYPGLRSLSLATWLADDSQMSANFRERMRASGMSHLIAVSGQHVVLLSALLVLVARAFAFTLMVRRGGPRGRWLLRLRSGALPTSALLLWVLCPGEGSVHRAFVTAVVAAVLLSRAWSTCRFHIFAIALSLAVATSPSDIGDWGFLLSLGGTFLLLCCMTSGRGWLTQYVGLSVTVPVLALPLQAHFFGSCDGWMLVHSVSWSWIWSFLWIPMGFVAPLGSFFPIDWLESGWRLFQDWVCAAAFESVPLPRPRFWEAIAWVFMLAGGALSLAAPCIDFRGKGVSNK